MEELVDTIIAKNNSGLIKINYEVVRSVYPNASVELQNALFDMLRQNGFDAKDIKVND